MNCSAPGRAVMVVLQMCRRNDESIVSERHAA